MSNEKLIENKGAKYSEMIINIVNEFDSQLPEILSWEDVVEIAIEAWNLANNKEFLESKNLYLEELKNHKYNDIIDKMVSYKLENFYNNNNVIIEYNMNDNRLQIKSQTQEEYFNSFLNNIINQNPIEKNNNKPKLKK